MLLDMSEKDHPETSPDNHLDREDLKRAEKGTAKADPLVATEEDAQVPDTELTNPAENTKESAQKNDPTSDRSPTS